MGNSSSRVVGCFVPSFTGNGKDGNNFEFQEQLDEGLGHSFCYVRPVLIDSPAITPSISERYTMDSSNFSSEMQSGSFRHELNAEDTPALHRFNRNFSETTFKSISGASVSANASTGRTGNNLNLLLSVDFQEPAATFESTASFTAIPLQPVPRGSGPLNGFLSGPLERGFISGPLERGTSLMSGPLDRTMFMSGPLDESDRFNFSAPLGYGRRMAGIASLARNVSRPMRRAFSRTFSKRFQGSGWMQRVLLNPVMQMVWPPKMEKGRQSTPHSFAVVGSSEPEHRSLRNLQWAHGKAGEDRVHVVLSEEQGWLFVGIYDGFSGPDAPDFLMSNLYKEIDKELEGLLWDYEDEGQNGSPTTVHISSDSITETQLFCVQSCNDHYNIKKVTNHLPSLSSEQYEIGGKSPATREYAQEDETMKEILKPMKLNYQEQGVMNQNFDEKSAYIAANSNQMHVSCKTKDISLRLPERSRRLYELFQMEEANDYKEEEPSFILNAPHGNSVDLLLNFNREFYSTDHKTETQIVSSSASFRGKNSCCLDALDGSGENEEVGSNCSKQGLASSVSTSGQKHISKNFLNGINIGKMFMKQKSLQKKLLPWSYDWHRDQHYLDGRVSNDSLVIRKCKPGPVDHGAVLKAMERALKTTEDAYAGMVERALDTNPELALMGSCVLVMLMKDQDAYVMNLGDSRAILAQDRLVDCYDNPDIGAGDSRLRNQLGNSLIHMELGRISEESPRQNQNNLLCSVNKSKEISLCGLKMCAIQLSTDHSTSIGEEVLRIKSEHIDDPHAIINDRVKGQLKVTRAFGAGFLKTPKFNDDLLEMFRVEYVGTSPYLSCMPSIVHHRLCSNDRFLVLSSDGLYQYFSNEEVVSYVVWFMENIPEGDPAQYLIAELLLRAAKKNGMDFHELLDIPQGDRRKYHDDVSVMVISLEGRIWRSSG